MSTVELNLLWVHRNSFQVAVFKLNVAIYRNVNLVAVNLDQSPVNQRDFVGVIMSALLRHNTDVPVLVRALLGTVLPLFNEDALSKHFVRKVFHLIDQLGICREVFHAFLTPIRLKPSGLLRV